jgi:transposase
MEKDILVMTQEELKRIELIKRAISKEICQWQVAKMLGICQRQVRRIVSRVKAEGEGGVIHRRRGKKNCRRLSDEFKAKVLKVYLKRYKGFGSLLASEKLKKHEGIRINRETLRQWLLAENYIPRRRIKRKHRLWRERKSFSGEMVQMDGSHHPWLEGRGPELVLMGYIDDATSRGFGRFYEYEGTIPALDSFKRYVFKYGIPTSVYLDKHSTYKTTHYDQWKAKVFGDEPPLSQFERSLKELGVNVIHANSAPAKGRIERFFRTLQDRLVKELRLANAQTLEEANQVLEEYLIEHNQRYMIEPAKGANLHRKAPSAKELHEILCIKNECPVRNDFTIVHEKKLYQITEYTSAKRIEVRNRLDGMMVIRGNGRNLKYKEITRLPAKKRIKFYQKSPFKRGLDKNRSWGTFKNFEPSK